LHTFLKCGPPHAGVDGDRHGAELEQTEHPDDQVVAGPDGEENPVTLGDTGTAKEFGGRIALLVQLAERTNVMEDVTLGIDDGRGFQGHSVRTVGSRDPKMAGDIASGVVHGL